jgi:hypothetical protein
VSALRRGYREVPYPLGTEEWKSFLNYAKEYYKCAIDLASDVSSRHEITYRAILSATVSPLVYLWEKWQLMSMEARLPYATPKYKKELEVKITEARRTAEKMHEKKGGNSDADMS